jgi:hypothetical protein
MSEPKSSPTRIAEQLAGIKISGPWLSDDASESLWAYREAAAVLTFFEPNTLQPLGEPSVDRAEAIRQLLENCAVVYDEQQHPGWILRPGVRRAAIRRLAERGAFKAALDANPNRSQSLLQQIYTSFLLGQARPIAEQSLDELAATLQVLDWVGETLPELPDRTEVRRLLDRERLLKPCRSLVGDHFGGRAKELQQLRDYVGVLPPGSQAAYLVRTVREYFNLHERPPLLIHGLGGVGKSTMVSKFILEHATLDEDHRIPFAYLDFDRPDLLADEPMTLLIEAARQLSVQYPDVQSLYDEIRADWERLQALPDPEDTLKQQSTIQRALGVDYGTSRQVARFVKMLERVGVRYRPFLVVLDTFEEVQYRSRDYVEELRAMLDELQQMIPRLRTVLAGRAPVTSLPIEELLLGDFDQEAAQGFLATRGVSDPALARQIYRQVGGNPLSLSLAASLLEQEPAGPNGIADLSSRTLFFLKVQENVIQGQLYRRILGHIHNEQVKRLAHPGLVLRRITPEIILRVLAQPCEVPVRTLGEAEQLFHELQREVSLVAPSDDGSLRHRSDIRRVMLDLLRQDEPEKVKEIHRRAVNYYKLKEGPAARAEEIYHRLSLGQQQRTINERWLPGVEDYLRSAIDELPFMAQTYLASRIGVELNEQVWQAASLSDWERRAERRARDLLRLNKPDRALQVLRERPERTPGSSLPVLEIQALVTLEQWEEARTIAAATIGQAPPNSRMLLDLLVLAAQADQHLGSYGEAEQALDRAAALAERLDDSWLALEIALSRLRLARRESAAADGRAAERKAELMSRWDRIDDKDLATQPQLVQSVASELGAEEFELLRRAVGIVGLREPRPALLDPLAQALVAWETTVARTQQEEPGILARNVGLTPSGDLARIWGDFVRQPDRKAIARAVAWLIERYQPIAPVATVAAEMMQSGLRLTGQQIKQFQDALGAAFTDTQALDQMVWLRLGERLSAITAANNTHDAIVDLIGWADVEGRTEELVMAAVQHRPGDKELRLFAEQLGLLATTLAQPVAKGSAVSPTPPFVDGIQSRTSKFHDAESWRVGMSQAEAAVCRVEVQGKPVGTGFLVGPDLVMTCFYIVPHPGDGEKSVSSDVALRFDFRRLGNGTTISQGQAYMLAEDWLVAGSPTEDLDYVLLRVAGRPGEDPAAGSVSGARGWLRPVQGYEFLPKSPLFILQHALGEPLKITFESEAIISVSPDRRRVIYRINTEPGSGGAPCLNQDWELVALHSRRGPQGKEGIPIDTIFADLEARGIRLP